jgi:hypothetical protein
MGYQEIGWDLMLLLSPQFSRFSLQTYRSRLPPGPSVSHKLINLSFEGYTLLL